MVARAVRGVAGGDADGAGGGDAGGVLDGSRRTRQDPPSTVAPRPTQDPDSWPPGQPWTAPPPRTVEPDPHASRGGCGAVLRGDPGRGGRRPGGCSIVNGPISGAAARVPYVASQPHRGTRRAPRSFTPVDRPQAPPGPRGGVVAWLSVRCRPRHPVPTRIAPGGHWINPIAHPSPGSVTSLSAGAGTTTRGAHTGSTGSGPRFPTIR